MSVLTLNGVELPLEYGSPTRMRVYNGAHGVRSHSGQPRTVTRSRAFEYKANTVLSAAADVDVYRALVEGDGHSIDFETSTGNPSGLATSRGLMPSGEIGGTVIPESPGFPAKYGEYYAVLDTAGLSYNVGYTNAWTVMAWRRYFGAWHHFTTDSNGNDFYDGVEGGTPVDQNGWGAVTGGLLTLLQAGGVLDVDNVVVLPYAVPVALMPGLYAFHAARAFPALPMVVAEGRAVQNASGVVCLGQVGEFRQEDTGELLESFDFTLHGSP